MRRCSRPCAGCPFREDSDPGGRALLDDYRPGERDAPLTEWVCHETIAADPFDSASDRLCAGAQIVAGLMSQVGRPACSLPNQDPRNTESDGGGL